MTITLSNLQLANERGWLITSLMFGSQSFRLRDTLCCMGRVILSANVSTSPVLPTETAQSGPILFPLYSNKSGSLK